MITRRLPMLGAAVVAGALVVAVGRTTEPDPAPLFSAAAATEPWMPSAPIRSSLSTTWYCPGVPASGEEGTEGEIIIANADPQPLAAHVTIIPGVADPSAPAPSPVEQDVSVDPQSRATVDVAAAVTAPFAGVTVEITGGTGVVEQRSTGPLTGGAVATSVAPCTTRTSPNWYLAEGYTAEGSREQLVLMNPYDSSATVQIRFATQDGTREPTETESYPVPPRSVRVLDMADLAARDEPEVAVSIEARRGELVVARAQTYAGSGRRGFAVSLAAPAARDQWWFADGEVGDGISERYSIYNPGDDDVDVTAALLGVDSTEFVPIDPITVPSGQVVTFSPADVETMPAGRHAMVFGTASLDARVVVERAMTRTFDDLPTTSVLLGAVARYEDGFVASTWTLGEGVDEPVPGALVVYNVDAQDATVTVQAVTAEGIVNVPGLEALDLPANGLVDVDLTDEAALGRQLIVRATARVFVERRLPRDAGSQGRVASWPLPVLPVDG